jgi:hypothetical protein
MRENTRKNGLKKILRKEASKQKVHFNIWGKLEED